MSSIFTHVPHPHIEQRHASGPTKVHHHRKLNHPNPIVRFNAVVGLRITLIVGTMWAAYAFTVIALSSAPAAFRSG
jgi:hypothetical protein